MRQILYSDEFEEFYSSQSDKIKLKFDYVLNIIQSVYNINTKFVKKIVNTDLYEMRIVVGVNQYRTILFAVDNKNIILSQRVILLNSFLKKSTKDYKSEIKLAEKILKNLVMTQIDESKISKLKSFNTHLDEKYGKPGTADRVEFNAKSIAYYYGEILREKRLMKNLTQQELADRIGRKRSYIGKIERGQTDMQLSSFIRIARELDIEIKLS